MDIIWFKKKKKKGDDGGETNTPQDEHLSVAYVTLPVQMQPQKS